MKNDLPYGNGEKVLLHICCAPDATYPVFYLRGRHYEVTGFFYNPNIYPEEEYKRRFSDVSRFAVRVKLPLIGGEYNPEKWFSLTKGYENEPEGARRCYICYRERLEVTARLAKDSGFDFFTTTLSISPRKNTRWIFEIGEELENTYGVRFLKADFKKRNGFKSSVILSRYYEMYRQDYCGCIFSRHNQKSE